MRKYLIIILPVIFGFHLFGQDSLTFQEVNKKSYQLYLDKDWKGLLEFGQEANKSGFNFFYLNLRTGIACLELKRYETAKPYLELAHQQNPTHEYTSLCLYTCYQMLARPLQASQMVSSLPDSLQEKQNKKHPLGISEIYIGGGIKLSDEPSLAGDLPFAELTFTHSLNKSSTFMHKHGYLQQDFGWGDVKQYDLGLAYTRLMPSGNLITPHFHLYHSTGLLDRDYTDSFSDLVILPTPIGPREELINVSVAGNATGTYTMTGAGAYFNTEIRENRLTFSPGIGYSMLSQQSTIVRTENVHDVRTWYVDENDNGTIVTDTTVILPEETTSETNHQFQLGAALSYTPPIFSDRLKLGLETQVPINSDGIQYTISSSVNFRASDKLWIVGSSYFGNAVRQFYDQGSAINSSIDRVDWKHSLLFDAVVTKRVHWYGFYQLEKRTDITDNLNYRLHTISTGIKIKL